MSRSLIQKKILHACKKRMINFGYRKVTMDEIAQDLSMSKNTIYKYFKSKEEIAEEIFDDLRVTINTHVLNVEKNEKDPLKVLSQNILFLQRELTPWFRYFLRDIQTELPSLWQRFISYRTEKILEIEHLVQRGIRAKKFRSVNSAIAVRAFLGAIDLIIDPEFLQKEDVSFQHAIDEVLDIWSKGIVQTQTTRGRKP